MAIRNLFQQLVPTWPPKLKTIKSTVQKIHLVNSCASTSSSKSHITGQAVKCNQSRRKIGGQCYLSSHQQSYSVKCAFFDQILQNPDSTVSAGGRGMSWGHMRGEEWAPALFQGWREKSLLLLCSHLQTLSLQSWTAVWSGLHSYTPRYAALPCKWKWEFICKFSYLSSGNHSKTCHSTTVWGRDNKMP